MFFVMGGGRQRAGWRMFFVVEGGAKGWLAHVFWGGGGGKGLAGACTFVIRIRAGMRGEVVARGKRDIWFWHTLCGDYGLGVRIRGGGQGSGVRSVEVISETSLTGTVC